MPEGALPRGKVPPGTYAGGRRSPIVYVLLCPPCGGYVPTVKEDPYGLLAGPCQGCGAWAQERHRFQALIMSNSGCRCTIEHPQVTGDLPDSDVAAQLAGTRTGRAGEGGEDSRSGWPDWPLECQLHDPPGTGRPATRVVLLRNSALSWLACEECAKGGPTAPVRAQAVTQSWAIRLVKTAGTNEDGADG